jgi:glutaredoxin
MQRDLTEYFLEYRCRKTVAKSNPEVDAFLDGIRRAVDEHDVVLFEKPGCGHCRRAKVVLAEHYGHLDVRLLIGSTRPGRNALKQALGHPEVSFPTIFVRGRYFGGASDLCALHDAGGIDALVATPRVPFAVGRVSRGAPQFLRPAGVGPGLCDSSERWCSFQMKAYANVVRIVSVLHIIGFALFLLLGSAIGGSAGVGAAMILAFFLALDMTLFVLFGPTPLSPMGDLATWIVWDWRGEPVPAVPYKVVFVAYIVMLVRILSQCGLWQEHSGGVVECAEHENNWQGSIVAAITNSALLAAFRF